MAIDAETEEQEAKRAKQQLLLLIVGAVLVGLLGLYGIGMLSDAAIRAGLQPKSWTRAAEEKRKAGPVEVVQAREDPEAVTAAPIRADHPGAAGRVPAAPGRHPARSGARTGR